MNFLESIKVAMASLWANKMRSFLTMLGIIIGISSVITIVALGQGSQAAISKEFEKFGANRVRLQMNWRENPRYEDRFDDSDVEAIKRVFKEDIKAVSPRASLSAKATKGREEASIYINGVNSDYKNIDNLQMIKGRFLTESGVKGKRNIAVIDKELAMKIFKRSNVIGEKIILDTNWSKLSYTIIGVYETPASTFDKLNMSGDNPTHVYIPCTNMKKLGMGGRYYSLDINVAQDKNVNKVKENIIKLIERRHRNSEEDYYIAYTAQQEKQLLDKIMGTLSTVVGAIAAISLLVGGIGVMNIMLVSVTERTREIGIRKAIGATRRAILIQFLIEAMIISGTGGIIGTILGQTISSIIALSIGIPPSVSIITVIIAVTFSCIVGIFFGIYPANKAAKLDPIDALRYE
ncbi:MAG: FtsX-like permease family protein [Firmicutes bacterium]|nr:FtsX-like permease family protein [Bacillota bacterium]